MKKWVLMVVLGMMTACTHKVEVDVKHVPPIEATVNVNLRIERDLDSYFAYENAEKYPLFHALKESGKIGETYLGYVAAVNETDMADHTLKTVVEGVNRDRAMIYGTLAKQRNTTMELMAARNAERNFRQAAAGTWVLLQEGWQRKP